MAVCVFLPVFLCSCGAVARPYQRTELVMDTFVTVTAYGQSATSGVDAVMAEFARLDRLWNRFDQESEIARISRAAGREPVKVSEDTLFIIKKSMFFSELTGGAFDITVGPLIDLWGFARPEKAIPDDAAIKRVLPDVGYQGIVINEGQGTVFLRRPGMSLDLGAIAKGYATDRARAILRQHGITSALVNAGGNIYAVGKKPGGDLWNIGIQDPRKPDDYLASVQVQDVSAVTSGDYQRFFEAGGVRYHHLLNPATGKPARTGLYAVTIISQSSTAADALSTSVFVLGKEKGSEVLAQFAGTDAFFVEEGNRVSYTPGLALRVRPPR